MNIVFTLSETQLLDGNVQKAIKALDKAIKDTQDPRKGLLEPYLGAEYTNECVVSSTIEEVKNAAKNAILRNKENRDKIRIILVKRRVNRISQLSPDHWDDVLIEINDL